MFSAVESMFPKRELEINDIEPAKKIAKKESNEPITNKATQSGKQKWSGATCACRQPAYRRQEVSQRAARPQEEDVRGLG